ncbi:MAG TPA: branched-chain amino acid ABC transporter permease, partial [Firmicutes bacterium]|nr:branched-chain amino acid ABC transporter permease [Bacillota bacterium]
IENPFSFFIFSGIFFLLVFLFFRRLYNSPFGRVLKAIREDEIVASALGKDIPAIKIWAFVISAGIAAISGALYAGYVTYIDPTSFTLDESIFIISVVIIGGTGNLKGPLVGTLFMIILPEILRFLGLPDTVAPNVRQIIFGLALIILMKYRPQGIAGEYRFE